MPSQQNFYLWGSWGNRVAKTPFLTQKVDARVRKVCIAAEFLIALRDDGRLVSWGEDTRGCLGLGHDKRKTTEPIEIDFEPPKDPERETTRIVDLQLGEAHCLALTDEGRVYAWGNHKNGQLGVGRGSGEQAIQELFEPKRVEVGEKGGLGEAAGELRIVQIVAVKNASFALTEKGRVYAWGHNDHGQLGFPNDGNNNIKEPRLVDTLSRHRILRLDQQKDAILGYIHTNFTAVEQLDIPSFLTPFGVKDPTKQEKDRDMQERDLMQGLALMRQVLDNVQKWWEFLMDMKHGSPQSMEVDPQENTAEQIDAAVDIEVLLRAVNDLERLIHTANKQQVEVAQSQVSGSTQKNTRRVLEMFISSCELRKERLKRTIESRGLVEKKRAQPHSLAFAMQERCYGRSSQALTKDHLDHALEDTQQLLEAASKADAGKTEGTVHLKGAIVTLCKAKCDLLKAQQELVKQSYNIAYNAPSPLPSLRAIRDKWNMMKHISVYQMYTEYDQEKLDGDDEKIIEDLVKMADGKLNHILDPHEKQKVLSGHGPDGHMAPCLCYDLLAENAELRKMCNAYQLKILVHLKGRLGGGAGKKS